MPTISPTASPMPNWWHIGDTARRCWMCKHFNADDTEKRWESSGTCQDAINHLRENGYPVSGDFNTRMVPYIESMTQPACCEGFDVNMDALTAHMTEEELLWLCPLYHDGMIVWPSIEEQCGIKKTALPWR